MTMTEDEQQEFEVLPAVGARIVCFAVGCDQPAVQGSLVCKKHLTALRRVMNRVYARKSEGVTPK